MTILNQRSWYAFKKEKKTPDETGAAGLRRIAFAEINDAVALMLRLGELDPDMVGGFDLFPVSEIKLPKGGGCEIKFYDRLKALELLLTYEQSQNAPAQASSFYTALESAAKSVCDTVDV